MESSLPEKFHAWLSSSIDEEGVGLNHAIAADADGKLSVYVLDLKPDQVYSLIIRELLVSRPRGIIFALDRFAKPGQGTTLNDLVAGHFIIPGQATRPFIIEYQHDPRIVHPINWTNAFWNAALQRELDQHRQLERNPPT